MPGGGGGIGGGGAGAGQLPQMSDMANAAGGGMPQMPRMPQIPGMANMVGGSGIPGFGPQLSMLTGGMPNIGGGFGGGMMTGFGSPPFAPPALAGLYLGTASHWRRKI
ncbi:hypothetical protein IFR04_015923 [Cadophora malorum]|uniref:Uncharacterized protein n=1 Tax=Cadophora malorum TaxID=108018 RepID=A0A8H7W0T8_9HELO|nr:hypothetical protein IFR04_015923 [Cadophora malorum]